MKQSALFRTIFFKLTFICSLTIISVFGAPGQWKAAALHSQEEGKQAVLVRVIEQNSKTIKLNYQTPLLTFRELR